MECPVCETSVSKETECPSCQEPLTAWRGYGTYSGLVRQRGLVQAHDDDLVGACVSFLIAGLSDPLNRESLVDAARALVHMNDPARLEDAIRLLELTASIDPGGQAAAMLATVKERQSQDTEGDEGPRRSSSPTASPIPCLRLTPLPRSRKPMKRQVASDLWDVVFGLEQRWQGDWRDVGPWTAAVKETTDPLPAAAAYLAGLQELGQGNVSAAYHAFAGCVDGATFLNPAVYCVYLSMGRPDAGQTLSWLESVGYRQGDVRRIRQELAGAIERLGDSELAKRFRDWDRTTQ